MDDFAFGNAHAATDGFAVGHLRDVQSVVFGRFGKEQKAALGGEVRALTEPVHVALAVADVADEDDAGEATVFERELLVDAEGRVLVLYRFDAGDRVIDEARGEDVDAHDLELRRRHRALIDESAIAGNGGGQHFALVVERRDEPVDDAVVFDAFTDGKDVRVGRFHVVVDDDGAVDGKARFLAELDVGPDACGDDHQVRFDLLAVFEFHAFDVPVAENGGGAFLEGHPDAELFDAGAEIGAARWVELAFHQAVHQVDHGYLRALHLQAAGGFEPQQTAADDDGFEPGAGAFQKRLGVIHVAEAEDAVLAGSFHRGHERRTARRDDQLVVFGDAAVIAGNGFGERVNIDDADAQAERDALLLIPFQSVDDDVIHLFFAGQHGGE